MMFPASLLLCQLPLRNWRQINVILGTVGGEKRLKKGEGKNTRDNERDGGKPQILTMALSSER